MRLVAIALAAGLASAALWYAALAVALDVTAWVAALLAALGAVLTFFAIARDAGRL
jgi:hypothetical protein